MRYGSALMMVWALAATPVYSAERGAAPAQGEILFANHGGIHEWRAVDDKGLYVRGQDGQWYYATLFASCFGLATTNNVGFETSPGGRFDRSSAILVEGGKCPVVSLVLSDPPPPPTKKK